MTQFQHIGIIIKPQEQQPRGILDSLLPFLTSLDLSLHYDESLQGNGFDSNQILTRAELARKVDVAIVIGGDGTLLDAARTLVEHEVPIIGVNIGRLGFLVDVSPDEMTSEIEQILRGKYYSEERTLLTAAIYRDGEKVADSLALNDVVLHVRDAVRMIEFETRIDGLKVHRQRADGIVVATPTGSTAYSLSGGGPILHPELDAFTLVPICPHTLSNRPIVVNSKSRIEIQFMSHNTSHAQVSFDGQANFDIEPEDRISIQRCDHKLHLIHPSHYDYYHILRKKLHWSEQP